MPENKNALQGLVRGRFFAVGITGSYFYADPAGGLNARSYTLEILKFQISAESGPPLRSPK